MIKFFRKIRQTLLAENKFNKYLVYAIGEIVLVVIGILIALQINNWNENRKFKNQEIEFLRNINSNLQQCSAVLETSINWNQGIIDKFLKLDEFIKTDLPYDNKFDTTFATFYFWDSPYLVYTAYESLKNKGINIIQNDSIRNAIIEIYEIQFSFLIKDNDRAEWDIFSTVSLPYYTKNIRPILNKNLARPNNFEKLKEDPEFINILYTIINHHAIGVSTMKNILKEIEDLIKMIQREINLRSD